MKAQKQKKPELKTLMACLLKVATGQLAWLSSNASQFPWLHERRSGGIGMKDACELAR
jgi:hypothetical protein